MLAAELGTRQINNYIALRRKAPAVNKHSKRKSQAQKPASNATINRELELLRRAINLGYRAEPQPVHVPMLPENNVREGILEHHEYVRLRDSLPAHYQLLLVCGYHLGTRLGELIKLRWEHVDLDRKEILIIADNSKTKKARVIPIYGEMEVFLRMAWERRNTEAPTCPWVMRVKERRMSFSWHGWQGYIAAVGLPDLLFHDLRRTAVTNMLDAGFTEKEAMSISGHTTNSMIKRYQIIRRGKMQSLGAKLAEYYSAKNEGLVSASKTV
jgi:integrase